MYITNHEENLSVWITLGKVEGKVAGSCFSLSGKLLCIKQFLFNNFRSSSIQFYWSNSEVGVLEATPAATGREQGAPCTDRTLHTFIKYNKVTVEKNHLILRGGGGSYRRHWLIFHGSAHLYFTPLYKTLKCKKQLFFIELNHMHNGQKWRAVVFLRWSLCMLDFMKLCLPIRVINMLEWFFSLSLGNAGVDIRGHRQRN